MAKLSETFAAYVAAKVRAGADVIQLFDSWVGTLVAGSYREHVAPWSARSSPPSTCRRSTSAPARRTCSPSSPPPAAT